MSRALTPGGERWKAARAGLWNASGTIHREIRAFHKYAHVEKPLRKCCPGSQPKEETNDKPEKCQRSQNGALEKQRCREPDDGVWSVPLSAGKPRHDSASLPPGGTGRSGSGGPSTPPGRLIRPYWFSRDLLRSSRQCPRPSDASCGSRRVGTRASALRGRLGLPAQVLRAVRRGPRCDCRRGGKGGGLGPRWDPRLNSGPWGREASGRSVAKPLKEKAGLRRARQVKQGGFTSGRRRIRRPLFEHRAQTSVGNHSCRNITCVAMQHRS